MKIKFPLLILFIFIVTKNTARPNNLSMDLNFSAKKWELFFPDNSKHVSIASIFQGDTIPNTDSLNLDTVKVENLAITKYLLTQSAFNLKKGETYYENNLIFINQVNISVSDNFSMGFGIIPNLSLAVPLFFNPKITFKAMGDLHFGVNSYIGIVTLTKNTFMAHQGILTYGKKKRNISISYGRYYTIEDSGNLFTVSAMVKVSKNISGFNEFIYHKDSESINIGGIRVIRNKIVFDLALLSFQNTENFVVIPYIGFKLMLNNAQKRSKI